MKTLYIDNSGVSHEVARGLDKIAWCTVSSGKEVVYLTKHPYADDDAPITCLWCAALHKR